MAKRVTNLPSESNNQIRSTNSNDDRKNYSNESYKPEDSESRKWASPNRDISISTGSNWLKWISIILAIAAIHFIVNLINGNNSPSPKPPVIETKQTNLQQYLNNASK